jgi:hypothetical protein
MYRRDRDGQSQHIRGKSDHVDESVDGDEKCRISNEMIRSSRIVIDSKGLSFVESSVTTKRRSLGSDFI